MIDDVAFKLVPAVAVWVIIVRGAWVLMQACYRRYANHQGWRVGL